MAMCLFWVVSAIRPSFEKTSRSLPTLHSMALFSIHENRIPLRYSFRLFGSGGRPMVIGGKTYPIVASICCWRATGAGGWTFLIWDCNMTFDMMLFALSVGSVSAMLPANKPTHDSRVSIVPPWSFGRSIFAKTLLAITRTSFAIVLYIAWASVPCLCNTTLGVWE